ncbi:MULTISPECIES: hypothetical protein [unclassified Nostoc]|uniref:hypothetical protein n=1 Tax=unclassified Nostoc TaxID=2593658 RepID=UPI0026200D8D|nr:hypothetical protein [Nostoc sp. S13]MDF5737203.1 hypothetical protein [Nostoc sp. S13]
MNTLPLQQWVIAFRWEHNGNLIDKKISKPEAERDNLNGAIIRIGGLVERKIIFPSDFDYIENPLFFDKDEKDIIDKVQFYAFKFNNQPSGSGYTKAKFSCQEDNLTLEIQN